MKHLSDYILETKSLSVVPILEDNEGNIILEGFWKKLGKLFGFSTDKVKQTIKSWDKELRAAYLAGQIAAAKLNDNKTKEAVKKQDAAAEKSSEDLLKYTKLEVQRLMKTWDKTNDVEYPFAQYKQLYLLSHKENDDEGKTLSEKFKKLIDDKFPDGGEKYKQMEQKINKAGVGNVDSENEDNGEKPKEPTEVTDDYIKAVISNNKQLLEPLVQATGGKLTGEQLASEVKELMKKNPAYKSKSKDAETSNIIGMCVIICGAMIMTSTKCIDRSVDWVKTNNKKLAQYAKANKNNQNLTVPEETGDKK